MRFEMQLTGPDHMALHIQPLNSATVVGWSFHQTPLRLDFKPPYYIYFSYGVNAAPLNFWLEVEVLSSFPIIFYSFHLMTFYRNPMEFGPRLRLNWASVDSGFITRSS